MKTIIHVMIALVLFMIVNNVNAQAYNQGQADRWHQQQVQQMQAEQRMWAQERKMEVRQIQQEAQEEAERNYYRNQWENPANYLGYEYE